MTTDPAIASERLAGVWNIVPTPFLDDGALDEASLPTLTRFVAGCGVDGMTILGVLGEASTVFAFGLAFAIAMLLYLSLKLSRLGFENHALTRDLALLRHDFEELRQARPEGEVR